MFYGSSAFSPPCSAEIRIIQSLYLIVEIHTLNLLFILFVHAFFDHCYVPVRGRCLIMKEGMKC